MPTIRKGQTYSTLEETSTRLDHQIDILADEIPGMIRAKSAHKQVSHV